MHRGTSRALIAALAAAMVAAGAAGPAEAQQKKPRIAVLAFDSSHIASGHAWLASSVVNGMFETELVKTGKFVVVERKRIESVLQEQGLQLSGAVDPTTAGKVGKILGVELVLVGDITKLGVKQAGGRTGIFGGVGVSKNTLEGGLDVRMVSTQTAQIVFAESEFNADASFSGHFRSTSGGTDFDETKIDKVFRPCVERLAKKMAEQVPNMVGEMRGGGGLQAKIANVAGPKIYLNMGSNEGVKVGDVFEIYRQGEEIRDPDTGAVLDVEMSLIGKVIVTEVKEKVSIATSQSGAGFQSGDIAKPPKS